MLITFEKGTPQVAGNHKYTLLARRTQQIDRKNLSYKLFFAELDVTSPNIVGKPPKFHDIQALDCLTVNVWPAIVIVPSRVIVGLIVTLKVTVLLPLIKSPLYTCAQKTLLFTAKSQFDGAVTVTEA